MNKALLRKIWLWVRWPLAVLIVFYIIVVLYRIPAVGEQQRTQEAIAKIQSQKITLADVMGDILPPVPNQQENDATVAGIDANNNGIRDDVELAIFKLHPGSARIRAAELQYAMTEQMFLTDVFNTDTWIEVSKEHSRAYVCVGESVAPKNLATLNSRTKEIDDLVFNTPARLNARDEAYKFTTSYSLPNTNLCNIDLNTLPN